MKKRSHQRRLHTPALHEKNVHRLHIHARKLNMPMTRLLNMIVCSALEALESAPDICDEEGGAPWLKNA